MKSSDLPYETRRVATYSSDFNPIELAWSKIKTVLHRLKARTFPDLIEALKQALLAITPQDIQGWFTHCGYAFLGRESALGRDIGLENRQLFKGAGVVEPLVWLLMGHKVQKAWLDWDGLLLRTKSVQSTTL